MKVNHSVGHPHKDNDNFFDYRLDIAALSNHRRLVLLESGCCKQLSAVLTYCCNYLQKSTLKKLMQWNFVVKKRKYFHFSEILPMLAYIRTSAGN